MLVDLREGAPRFKEIAFKSPLSCNAFLISRRALAYSFCLRQVMPLS
jgi:hypothetical protein